MQEKFIFYSKTIQGIILMLLPILNQIFKVEIVNDDITAFFSALIGLVGAILAIYGRFKANEKIGWRINR